MKIAVSSQGNNMDSEIDPRFGRAAFFAIINTESGEEEFIENENVNAGGGAGVNTGTMIAEKGVEAVLTGNIGPSAFTVLQTAGIKMHTGISGSVKKAVEEFKKGNFTGTDAPTVSSHSGMR